MEKAERVARFLDKEYGPIEHWMHGQPFQTLISCILSQRARDEQTEYVSGRLFKVARTPDQLARLPLTRLQRLIRPIGTYKQKAKYIKESSRIIRDQYKGRVPRNRDKLMELPGVSWKTSAIVMAYGFGIPIIAVDTHVNRTSKRLGIAGPKDNVEKVREKLQKFFPKRHWLIINIGMIRFGKDICKPITPWCSRCGLRDVCRYYRSGGKRK
jgi:endonuclease-3